MTGTRVLVTGAGGVIGRHVVTTLAAGDNEVYGVSLGDGDLLDPLARGRIVKAAQADILVHLAWETAHGKYWTAQSNRDWASASFDLIARFAKNGGRRVVVAGSCAEYDWERVGTDPIGEDAPLGPQSSYGLAKAQLAKSLADYSGETGLSWAWARIFLLYGNGEDRRRFVPAIANALLSGEPALCTPAHKVRDYLDSRDVGAALGALAVSDVSGPVNIGSGIATAIGTIATNLGQLAGKPELIRTGALAERPGEPIALLADVTRLRREVGFVPEVPLSTGLADALAYWRRRTQGPAAA